MEETTRAYNDSLDFLLGELERVAKTIVNCI